MKKQTIIFFFLFFVSIQHLSCQTVQFNENCQQAYNQILALHLDSADSVLILETLSNKDNAYVPYLKNYIDFVRVFVSQDERLYEDLKSLKSEYFEEIEKLNDTCRYKKWILGNMHLQWAVLKIIFGDYISAAFEFNNAYQLIENNTREFPNFRLNDLSLSVLKIIIGLVPEHYNWFISLFSMDGDVEIGKKQLFGFLAVTKSDTVYAPFFYEALFYSAFIEMNIYPDQKKLSGFIKETENIDKNITLITFLQTNLFMRTGMNEKALKLLDSMELKHHNTYPFFYMNYLYGECLLRGLRLEESIEQFDLFLEKFKGENYLKDAYRKKAWAASLMHDTLKYKRFMQKVNQIGSAKIDIDKEALVEAQRLQYPNRDLVLARILFDGGYYNEALDVLNFADTTQYQINEKVSYIYRIARIYQQMNYTEKSREYYKIAIDLGGTLDEYFAANAALQLGGIYESEGNKALAKDAYLACLQMEYKIYKKSINRRAREGLKRLSE